MRVRHTLWKNRSIFLAALVGKNIGAVVVLLVICASNLAAQPLSLGKAQRMFKNNGYLYTLPISIQIDGYSTFRAVLVGGDVDFLSQTSTEIIKTDRGAALQFWTPRHLASIDITARVEYQGRSVSKTYRLLPVAEIAQDGEALLYGCRQQWVIRGTLINNIVRIFRECGRRLGRWPLLNGADYVDFVITQSIALPLEGGLSELLDFVRDRFGFKAATSKSDDVIGFVDLVSEGNY